MKWKLVLLLAAFGVVMGLASVLGWTAGIELWLWLAIAVICIIVLLRLAPAKLWLHCFFVGLIGGGVAPVIQFALFASYVANNPELQQEFAQLPGWLEPRYFVLLLAPVAGLASGGVLAVGGLVAAKTADALRRR
ncbi:MAG TPA: hypothetical protein VNI78_01460 [Vicinamibacterales bacterium]|nr:hypothetical protein [Vicinamibacterales bacterium]